MQFSFLPAYFSKNVIVNKPVYKYHYLSNKIYILFTTFRIAKGLISLCLLLIY